MTWLGIERHQGAGVAVGINKWSANIRRPFKTTCSQARSLGAIIAYIYSTTALRKSIIMGLG